MSRSTRNAIFLHRTDAVCGRRTRPVSHADAPRIHRAQVKQDLEDKGVAVDKVTEAVLRGANPEDGGGVGISFQSSGNGDCFLNAIATMIIAKSRRGDRRKAIIDGGWRQESRKGAITKLLLMVGNSKRERWAV